MFKHFYALAKPGIIYGNIITLAGGFIIASRGQAQFGLFLATFVGLALVIGCGAVFNNLLDRDIDAKMQRTKDRELVTGVISLRAATAYGSILGVLGFWVLWVYTNILTVEVALFGCFAYIVLYTLWAKRTSLMGPLVGSLAGAVPPVVGYCAVSNRLDAGAYILFGILVLWQIPHFYAIAIFRQEDYMAAGIPVLPEQQGIRATKVHMLLYIVAFAITSVVLAAMGYAGVGYLVTAIAFSLAWLALAIKGFFVKEDDDKKWARKMFFLSLAVLMAVFIAMCLNFAFR